jgi:predicted DNA-binding transcriptional regulator YafY
MRQKCTVSFKNNGADTETHAVPLKIYISAQNGRSHLMAYQPALSAIRSFRIDRISEVKLCGAEPRFDELRSVLRGEESRAWGVTGFGISKKAHERYEHVEFTIRVGEGEEYIVRRLNREKRCGRVEKVDESTYRFTADVHDTNEMMPWIRTFICRIVQMNFSNRTVENRLKSDIREMYRIYGIGGDEK